MSIKLLIASLLIPIGILFGLAIATEYVNPKTTHESQSSTIMGGLILGLPAMIIGTGFVGQEYSRFSKKLAAKQRRLQSIFIYILAQNGGKISVNCLRQYTQISQKEAEHFLEQKATLLKGTLKRYKTGEIYYFFDNKENKKK